MGMTGIQNVAELKQCRLLRFVCDATLLVIVFFSLQSLLTMVFLQSFQAQERQRKPLEPLSFSGVATLLMLAKP